MQRELQIIADQLRAIGQTGLFYARREDDEYDIARYERVLALAARLFALTDTRSAEEILALYNGDINYQTPKVAAFGALFDAQGRVLLMQRSDNRLWALPGGMVEVGETAAQAAEREFWEETGVRVRAERLLGIYDNRAYGGRCALSALYGRLRVLIRFRHAAPDERGPGRGVLPRRCAPVAYARRPRPRAPGVRLAARRTHRAALRA